MKPEDFLQVPDSVPHPLKYATYQEYQAAEANYYQQRTQYYGRFPECREMMLWCASRAMYYLEQCGQRSNN